MPTVAERKSDREIAPPMEFIEWDKRKKKFVITRKAAEFFTNIREPLAIVAVAGPMRQGKSYIMNRLNDQQEGFPLGSQTLSKTQGAWIWECRQEFVDEDGRPFKTILMDFEGLFDPQRKDKPKRYDMGLMTFACLLSSLLVYNTKGNIDSNAIETLQLMTKVVGHLKMKDTTTGGRKGNMPNYFPSLLWILRDFFLEMVDAGGDALTPKEYLDSNLSIAARIRQTDDDNKHGGSSDSSDSEEDEGIDPFSQPIVLSEGEKGLLAVKSMFKDRDLFTLCCPVADEKRLRHLEDVAYEELKPQFRRESKKLVEKIFGIIRPKKLYDIKGKSKVASGAEYLEYAKVIIQAYNDDKSLVFDDAWKSVAALSCQRAKTEAFKTFLHEMADVKAIIESGQPVENDHIEQCYGKARDVAMDKYVDLAVSGPPSQEIQQELVNDTKQLLTALSEDNMKLSNKACVEWLGREEERLKGMLQTDEIKDIGGFLQLLKNVITELQGNEALGPWRNLSAHITDSVTKRLTEHAVMVFKVSEQQKEMIQKVQEFENHRIQAEQREEELRSAQHHMETEVKQMKVDRTKLEKEFKNRINEANREALERQTKLTKELQKEGNENLQAALRTQRDGFNKTLGKMTASADKREKKFEASLKDMKDESKKAQDELKKQIAEANEAAEKARQEAAANANNSSFWDILGDVVGEILKPPPLRIFEKFA